ncbi:MAG: DMT family transporter [Thermoanaerobaculia bacterium]
MSKRDTTEGAAIASGRSNALWTDLSLVLVTAIWGSTFIVNRLVLETTPPLLFLLLRFTVGGTILLLLAARRPWTPFLLRDSAVIGILLAVGIGCQVVGQLFTTASKAAFVTGLSVPLTPVVGFLTTRKLPSLANMVGLSFAAFGFGLMSWPKDAVTGVNVGDLLILGTAFAYGYLFVYVAEAAGRHDVRWFSAGQVIFGAIFIGIFRLLLLPFLHRPEPFFVAEARPLPHTTGLLYAVLWMAILATVVTFLIQTWAQARMSATHAAILFALEPVFTAVFAAAILKERMSARDFSGAALVLLGIVISELPLGRR